MKKPGDVLIGELFSFAGTLAGFGGYLDPAVQQAIDEINLAGGINGKTLGYVQCDDATEPSYAVSAVDELLRNFPIGAIVGPVSSRCTVAIADIVRANQVVLMSPVNQVPALATLEDQGFIFRSCASAAVQVPIIAKIFLDEGWMTAFSFHQNDAYGNAMYGIFEEEYTANGGQVNEFVYLETDDNYAENAIAAAKDSFSGEGPQAIANMTYVEDGAAIMRTAAGWRQPNGPQWFMANAMKQPEFVRKVGLEYVTGTRGTCVAYADDPDSTDDAFDKFAADFEQKWGDPPADFAANAYDAVYLLAIAMAFSSDPTSGVQIRDNLAKTQSGTVVAPNEWAKVLTLIPEGTMDFEGASGPLLFDKNGDVLQNIQEWIVGSDGLFRNVRCWGPGATQCDR